LAENYTGVFKHPGWPSRSLDEATSRGQLGLPIFTIDDDYGVKAYKYVLFGSNVTAGAALAFTDLYSRTVSTTHTNSLNRPAGVAIAAGTSGQYGVIQCYGYYATIATNGDDDIADDTTLILGGSGTCDSVAAGTASTYRPLAIALAADVDASNTVAGHLVCVF